MTLYTVISKVFIERSAVTGPAFKRAIISAPSVSEMPAVG